MFAGDRQHAAGSGRWVVEGTNDARLGQGVVVLDEKQIDHQANDFARREMFPGGFVREFGELADQFFENRPHLGIADGLRVQIDVGELFSHQIEQPGFGEPIDLSMEVEAFEDVPHRGRKALHVGEQIFLDVVLIAHQLLHVQGRRVVKQLPGLAQQERFGIHFGLLPFRQLGQHGRLGGFQHAVQPPQHGERQDDFAVFGLLVIAAQQIGDGPDEG